MALKHAKAMHTDSPGMYLGLSFARKTYTWTGHERVFGGRTVFRAYRDDAANVAKRNLPRRTDGATVVSTKVHVEPTHDNRHGRVGSAGDEKERAVLHVGMRVDGE